MKTQHAVSKPRPPAAAVATANGSQVTGAARERWLHGGVTLEEATRVRAYQLWERAGHPEGDGVSFWLEAEAELSAGG